MPAFKAFIEGKKITLLGLGLLGRGVGGAAFLAECGARVLVTDKKSEAELKDSVDYLKKYSCKYPNITFRLGGHDEADFTSCDMVIKAAGVPLDSPYIAAAKKAGVPVYMSTALFAKFALDEGIQIVGVTGTRGKTTVTQMIQYGLEQTGRRSFSGGNQRGISTIALLPLLREGDIAVLELDSWQLQGFGDLTISPHIAVFTNLMPDHQNYYKDMDEYFNDKANIFKFQKQGDALIAGKEIAKKISDRNPPVSPLVPDPFPEEWQLKIPGEHNRENAVLAAQALRSLGVSESEIKKGLESFQGVEGRLQFAREVNGIKIYNDNNATTPDATIAALKALDTGSKNIVLIMGGSDKGLDMNAMLYEIAKTCKRVICLVGSGTDRITPFMSDFSIYDNLQPAVKEALSSAETGDVVLFSPSFASFGMFKNEYERNDQFMHQVELL